MEHIYTWYRDWIRMRSNWTVKRSGWRTASANRMAELGSVDGLPGMLIARKVSFAYRTRWLFIGHVGCHWTRWLSKWLHIGHLGVVGHVGCRWTRWLFIGPVGCHWTRWLSQDTLAVTGHAGCHKTRWLSLDMLLVEVVAHWTCWLS